VPRAPSSGTFVSTGWASRPASRSASIRPSASMRPERPGIRRVRWSPRESTRAPSVVKPGLRHARRPKTPFVQCSMTGEPSGPHRSRPKESISENTRYPDLWVRSDQRNLEQPGATATAASSWLARRLQQTLVDLSPGENRPNAKQPPLKQVQRQTDAATRANLTFLPVGTARRAL